MVSFDGNKEWHDAHRVDNRGMGTHDRTVSIIRYMKSDYRDYYSKRVCFNSVYGSVHSLKDSIDYYVNNNITKVIFNPILNDMKPYIISDDDEYKIFMKDNISKYVYGINDRELLNYRKVIKDVLFGGVIKILKRKNESSINRIAMGCKPFVSQLHLNSDKSYSFCYTYHKGYKNTTDMDGIIEKYQDNIEKEYIKYIKEECLGCWARSMCRPCPINLINSSGNVDLIKFKKEQCDKIKKLIYLYFEILVILNSYNPAITKMIFNGEDVR